MKKKTYSRSILSGQPSDMTLEQWQIALRKYAAEKEEFAIAFINQKTCPGDFSVTNPVTKRNYKVVYRGEDSEWNYCSCPDFRSNQLGTCKHLEAVKVWLEENDLGIPGSEIPSYTSIYIDYKGDRKVKIRIGSDNRQEFEALAAKYFTPEGEFPIRQFFLFSELLREATKINSSFRCYEDVYAYILNERERSYRQRVMDEDYKNDKTIDALLKATLYPYQREGIRFAARAGKSIIADEMGLGKTLQAIGTAELLKKENLISSVLILCPTSLKYLWKSEIEKFSNSDAIVVEGNHMRRKELYVSDHFYKIVSYNSACNDLKIMKKLHVDMLIMDEAQRLKNWKTQIAQAIKRIDSDYTTILSGTPLENKLEELYSIVQYVDMYCLGPYYKFIDRYTVAAENGKRTGYRYLNEIGEKLQSVLIRRKKKDVALQLPQRMDKILFVPMTAEQRAMHDEYQVSVSQIVYKWRRMKFLSEKDRKRLLLFLSMMRMVCDSTFILDQKSRNDTKIDELMQILSELFENGDEKVVVFSQWERMGRLVAQELDKKGIGYEFLHGGVPSPKRKALMDNFTHDPDCRVFISTDAGSTGLNLQVASMIVNLDLPWNPAVLEQRIARIYRIGQQRNIQVLNFVAKDTIEERMLSTLNFKSALFEGILDNGADAVFLEDSKFNKLMDIVDDITKQSEETSAEAVETITEEAETPAETTPEELLQQGFSFFSQLAKTLSSPEKTQQFVSSIVEEDKESGKTVLKIPVPDKETVANVLNIFAKMMSAK